MNIINNPSDRNISIAGINIPFTSNVLILSASASGNSFDTFIRNDGGSTNYYQVPAGKKLVIRGIRINAVNTTPSLINIGTATVAVSNSGSVPTGAIGYSMGSAIQSFALCAPSIGAVVEIACHVECRTAGRYPYLGTVSGGANQIVYFICEEVAL